MTKDAAAGEQRAAVAAGVVCYIIWGFVPLVFQAIAREGASAWEILAERVVWGGVAAGVFVAFARQWPQVLAAFRDRKTLALLALSAVLIGANWTAYIYAVNAGHVLEASLGYYVTPLVNMLAGALLFREKLNRLAMVAIGLAALGVVTQALAIGHVPLVSVTLAVSFGGYGIVRKWVKVDAQAGLFVECMILLAPAAIYIGWLEASGAGHFLASPAATAWLVASGPITAAPLALFAWSARRMPLTALGFLQFLSPTISFGIGLAQGEAFSTARAISFAFIWAGVAVFVFGAVRSARAARIARDLTPAG